MSNLTPSMSADETQIAEFWRAFLDARGAWEALSTREKVMEMNLFAGKYFPNIAFELLESKSGEIETLCISAHGATSAFPLVMDLVDQAPPLGDYKPCAFRARVTETDFAMSMNDFTLSSSEVLIGYYADGLWLGMEIRFAREIPSEYEDHAKNMAFIMLDHIIGEYDFAVKVGNVCFSETWSDAIQTSTSLDRFPAVFDSFWTCELGHTGVFPLEDCQWAGLDVTFNSGGANGEPEETAFVRVNDGAKALAMRADLAHAITLTLPASNSDELERAQEKQEQIANVLEQPRSGILVLTMLRSAKRQAVYYVSDAAAARASIERVMAPDPYELEEECDFTWSKYCRFADR